MVADPLVRPADRIAGQVRVDPDVFEPRLAHASLTYLERLPGATLWGVAQEANLPDPLEMLLTARRCKMNNDDTESVPATKPTGSPAEVLPEEPPEERPEVTPFPDDEEDEG